MVRLSFNLDKSSASKTGLCKFSLLHTPNASFQPCSDVEHVSPFSGKHRRILLQLLRQPMCQQHLWLGSTIFSGISRLQVLYFMHRLHTLTPFLLFQYTLPNLNGVDPNYLYPQALAKQLSPYNSTQWSTSDGQNSDISAEFNHDAYLAGTNATIAQGWDGSGVIPGGRFWFQVRD